MSVAAVVGFISSGQGGALLIVFFNPLQPKVSDKEGNRFPKGPSGPSELDKELFL